MSAAREQAKAILWALDHLLPWYVPAPKAGRAVIRSAEELQHLWLEQGGQLEKMPKVDFTTSMVVGLFIDAGTYTTIPSITAIQQQDDVLTIVCGMRSVPWPAINPVSVIIIPRFEGTVIFVEQETQAASVSEKPMFSRMPEGQTTLVSPSAPLPPSRRPFGITILTVLNCIFSGFFPLLSTGILIARTDASIMSTAAAFVQAILACAILWFSATAWRGNDHARQHLLSALTIYYGLQIVSAVLILGLLGVSEAGLARVLGLTARSLAWVAINRWYFRRPSTLAWFQS